MPPNDFILAIGHINRHIQQLIRQLIFRSHDLYQDKVFFHQFLTEIYVPI